jgi:hypothetical protein
LTFIIWMFSLLYWSHNFLMLSLIFSITRLFLLPIEICHQIFLLILLLSF